MILLPSLYSKLKELEKLVKFENINANRAVIIASISKIFNVEFFKDTGKEDNRCRNGFLNLGYIS